MLKRLRLNREAVLVIVLMAVFTIFTGFSIYEQQRDRAAGFILPAGSYSGSGDGLLALYRLADAFGFRPGRWERSAFRLPPTPMALVVVRPYYPPYDKEEASALLEWAAKGNTLFIIDNPGNVIEKQLGIEIGDPEKIKNKKKTPPELKNFKKHIPDSSTDEVEEPTYSVDEYSPENDKLTVVPPSMTAAATKNINSVTFSNKEFIVKAPGSAIPLFGEFQRANAVYLPWKKGRIIIFADAAPFINRNIDKADNARFILQALKEWGVSDRVFFDEYHHGIQQRDSMLGVMLHTPVGWGILQFLFGVILILFGMGYRFSSPREEKTPGQGRRKRIEYIKSMAGLLQKKNAAALIEGEIVAGFREDLAKALGLSPNTTSPALISYGKKEKLIPEKLSDEFLKLLSDSVISGPVTEKGLLRMTALMEKIINPIRRKRI
ncbi:MAG: DUF4350 domain-containing protein [Chloroflexi bacterium]|nr:DUF4350 domain-containing protein [Chloroflexota bacterium]